MLEFVLLVFNIQSNTNIGQLIRTANAFGVKEICVVGRKKFSRYGNQQTSSKTHFRHFYRIDEAIDYYLANDYDLVGVEITGQAKSINQVEFSRDTVFILGNEGSGIQEDILRRCGYCVYIPQFGSGASINVNTASGIVFNAFNRSRVDSNRISEYKFIPE